ncbi:MAG: hypothetical protein A2Y10_02560 [Planctomycetes bacterium GWF2_41_51]|nr:MAG: hypothetical protein A2Y10_02560 [Planctomycetes bacterium GWF2_41_51]HBG25688.1 hypothetical protein [Phycisphaerales bacterium]
MANLNNFNANNVEAATDFDPIPAGKYPAVIVDSEMKAAKNGNGSYLELKFEIIEGDYKNRLLWSRLSLENQNDTTVKIAKSQLAAICKAVGVMVPKDSTELHNLPLVIKVVVKKRNDTGEPANEIKAFSKRENAAAQNPPAAKGVAPWKR